MKFGSVTIGGKKVAEIGSIMSRERLEHREDAPAMAPFSFSATFTLCGGHYRELMRALTPKLPLKKRRRRHSEKRVLVSVGAKVVGVVRGSDLMRMSKRDRGSHRNWMEAGRARA